MTEDQKRPTVGVPFCGCAFLGKWRSSSESIVPTVLTTGFVQSLEFLKKSWNLSSYFPDLEKVWKRWSLEKMIKSLVFFFFQIYNKCFFRDFFSVFFFKSYSTSSVCLQCSTKKALFLRFKASIDHLFDNLESGGRNYCFGKSSGKSLAFSIQKSVWTLLPALCVTSFFRWFFFPNPLVPHARKDGGYRE